MAENFTLPCTTKVLQCISVHSSSSEQDSLCRLVGVCSLMYILPGLRSPPPSCRDWPTHRLTQKRHQKLKSQIASHTSFETSRGDRWYRQASTQAPPLPHSRKRRSAAHSSPFQMQMQMPSWELVVPRAPDRTARVGAGQAAPQSRGHAFPPNIFAIGHSREAKAMPGRREGRRAAP